MATLRHIALQARDPEKTATYFEAAFGMERIRRTDASITEAGGKAFLHQDAPDKDTLFFEREYWAPESIVFDVSANGWAARKSNPLDSAGRSAHSWHRTIGQGCGWR